MLGLADCLHTRDRETRNGLAIGTAARPMAKLHQAVNRQLYAERILDEHMREVHRHAVLEDAHVVHLMGPAELLYEGDHIEHILGEDVQIDVASTSHMACRYGANQAR